MKIFDSLMLDPHHLCHLQPPQSFVQREDSSGSEEEDEYYVEQAHELLETLGFRGGRKSSGEARTTRDDQVLDRESKHKHFSKIHSGR